MATIAAENGISPEEVEHEMMEAIRAGMASSDPHAQALWKQICPDGKVPDLDPFLYFVSNQVDMTQKQKHRKKKQMDFGSVATDFATLPIIFYEAYSSIRMSKTSSNVHFVDVSAE